MAECSQTNTPSLTQIEDPCNGDHKSTECVFSELAISYLGTGANASLKTILDAIVTKLQEID